MTEPPSTDFSRREALAVLGGGLLTALHASCSREPTPAFSGAVRIEGPLHYASLLDVAQLIQSGEISPVELTQLMLDRIEAVDGRLNAYATVMAEHALEAARTADREIGSGLYRGPLHGIPVAVKDLCYTRGVRTMGGLGVLADFVPEYDGTAVARLEAAGAVLLGKLNLTEGAFAGYHPDFEVPVNPWDAALWPGASSSGSGVATAAGLCFASLGTDTGGSIRFPSLANGTVGLKPTYGRVSRYGVLPLAESMDHVGPLARRVADAAVVLEAIAGFDANDPTSLPEPVPDMLGTLDQGVAGLQIGFDRRYATAGVDRGLVAAIETALGELEDLGAEIVDAQMPEALHTEAFGTAWFTICAYEAHKAHAANFPSRAGEYGAYFREVLEMGAGVTDAAYEEARLFRAAFDIEFRAALSDVDALVAPAGGVPFPMSEEQQRGGMAAFEPVMPMIQLRFTAPADFAGTPGLAMPCGVTESGVPYTIQLLARRLGEAMLCRIGHAYEQATDWHTRHPSV